MKNKVVERCYFCVNPSTTREHVPPKQMFKAFQCDSITVPSCDEHNSKKGKNDQAIVSAFLIPLHSGRKKYPLKSEILDAIQLALPSFEKSKRFAVPSRFLKDPPKNLEDLPDLAHLEPSIKMIDWIRQLTAGIVYSKIGLSSTTISWPKASISSPDWFQTNGPSPITYHEAVGKITENQKQRANLDKLSWYKGWSAIPRPYPEIIYTFSHSYFPR